MYNALIRANSTKVREPISCESLILYKKMLSERIVPDCITLPFVLKECLKTGGVEAGPGVHCHLCCLGLKGTSMSRMVLISFYTECGLLRDARKVFDVVSWNSIISGYLRGGELDMALGLFWGMKERKNVITWNTIITGLVQGGREKEGLKYFYEMQVLDGAQDGILPDNVTVASAISACASLGAIDQGKWVHSYLERHGIETDMVIETALVNMYGRCGCVEKAFEVFSGMRVKDATSWTAMISVLALHGRWNEAFQIFEEMEASGVKPNALTYIGLLSACAHAGLIRKGQWSFERMKHVHGIEPQVEHFACMVDLVGRAGIFLEVEKLIRSMPMEPDVYVWGALLGGCQLHGNIVLGEKVAQYLIDLEPENHAFYMNSCDTYAKANRFNDAKRIRSLMKVLNMKQSVTGGSMIEIDGIIYELFARGSDEGLLEALNGILMLLNHQMKVGKPEVVCIDVI